MNLLRFRSVLTALVTVALALGATGLPAASATPTIVAAPAQASASNAPDFSAIIGGGSASITDSPWQVGLLSGRGSSYDYQFCGGSIINPEWVLTAAHCLADHSGYLGIFAGGDDLEESGHEYAADAWYVHPGWTATNNDIALVHLAAPLPLDGVTMAAIELPYRLNQETPWPAAGAEVLVTGWGEQSGFGVGDYPTLLNSATLEVVSGPTTDACGEYSATEWDYLTELCVGAPNAVADTCQGDSGGPYAIDVAGTWTLAGVTSWGYGCATVGYPGMAARVTSFLDWITPGLPGNVAASLRSDGTSVDLSWTAPAVASRALPVLGVTDYIVEISDDNGQTWYEAPGAIRRTATGQVVAGLTPGTSYVFRVGAVNIVTDSDGPGKWSESSPVTGVAPTAATATIVSNSAHLVGSGTDGLDGVNDSITLFADFVDPNAQSAVTGTGVIELRTPAGALMWQSSTSTAAATSATVTVSTALANCSTSNCALNASYVFTPTGGQAVRSLDWPVVRTLSGVVSAQIRQSDTTFYPTADGYKDSLVVDVESYTTTGNRLTTTGSTIAIKNSAGTVVATKTITHTGSTRFAWNGKVGGKVKPGRYSIVYTVKSAAAPTMKVVKISTVVVSAAKLIPKTISVTKRARDVFSTYVDGGAACLLANTYIEMYHVGSDGVCYGNVASPSVVRAAANYAPVFVTAKVAVARTPFARTLSLTSNDSTMNEPVVISRPGTTVFTMGEMVDAAGGLQLAVYGSPYAKVRITSVTFTYTYRTLR